MRKTYMAILAIATAIMGAAACSRLDPKPLDEDQTLDGPIGDLTMEQSRRHVAGDEIFNGRIFTAAMGLGPLFVSNSCGSCHASDGKGHPFLTLTRFGHTDSLGQNEFDHGFQLQNHALPGYEPETLPAGAVHASFVPPVIVGMGYIAGVPEGDILAMAEENLTNPDGVRGHPNWNLVPTYLTPPAGARKLGNRYICRFGKKGGAFDLLHQTVVAFNQDMGITSTFDPSDVYTLEAIDPEITDKDVNDVVFYLKTLKAPSQRDVDNPMVRQGQMLFSKIGCASCHRETLKTGPSNITALNNQEFSPYTDLLLHEMGSGLNDGYTEGSAGPSEWRTPPLWGLGLTPKSQGGRYFLMHDGRAKSIDEAIRMHGGEAEIIKNRYNNLSQGDRDAVLKFLESL